MYLLYISIIAVLVANPKLLLMLLFVWHNNNMFCYIYDSIINLLDNWNLGIFSIHCIAELCNSG